jgi:glycosyltransferase involved in cell wall biosynthesis
MLFKFMEKTSAPWKDIIILNNEHDFLQAEKIGIKPRQELTIVANGLDVYKLDFLPAEESRKEILNKIGNTGAKTIIGTIANFYPAKGLRYLIETAESFKDDPNIIFVVIGDGNERQDLEFKIKDLGLENKVFLIGQLKDAYRYLTAFDIFVLPSVKEGFPWAVIEAMAARLPVIATSVGAVPEIIESGKNGIIVPPANPQAIEKAIRTILESSKLAQELGIQAHQRVLFKYELDKMVRQIEELF